MYGNFPDFAHSLIVTVRTPNRCATSRRVNSRSIIQPTLHAISPVGKIEILRYAESMRAGRYATIPSRSRASELQLAIDALLPQTDFIVVVINDPSNSVVWPEYPEDKVLYIYEPMDPPNLSKLWNIGLDACSAHARSNDFIEWDTAVVNDDCTVPQGWFDACVQAMDDTCAVAASTDITKRRKHPLTHCAPGPVNLYHRLCGYAFMLRGEAGVRADETLCWWYGDDDIDWQSRVLGGTVIVPGFPVTHTHPNESTVGSEVLSRQAGLDRETFLAKWGSLPC